MKWVAIIGSWRNVTKEVEQDVQRKTKEIIDLGLRIVTGGALGVDYNVIHEAIHFDPLAQRIKIILPTNLDTYEKHYRLRASEGIITNRQASQLILLLRKIKLKNPKAVKELHYAVVNKNSYYRRNSKIIEVASKVIAFQVNKSEGTQDTIDKAHTRKIPVEVHEYSVKS